MSNLRTGARRLARWWIGLLALVPCRAQEATAPLPRGGDYVGVAECTRCHESQQRKLLGSQHAAILAATALHGCETCHGPGHAHATDADHAIELITMPPRLDAAAQTAFCGRCHQDQIVHHGGDMAGLQRAAKTCTDCHEVHQRRAAAPAVAFATRQAAMLASEPIGASACIACHPIRDELLARSVHAGLAADARDDGCELCHGNGSQHQRSNGRAAAITRPDRAGDGAATCRTCHANVDEREFHWRGRQQPFLAAGITCATCHRVHVAKIEVEVAAAALATRIPRPPSAAAAGAPATNRMCALCHVPALCTMPGSTHASLGGPDVALEHGCDSCHRGGEQHARSGGRRALVQRLAGSPAAEQASICLLCHRTTEALRHVEQGVHQRRGVGCVDCHGPLHGAVPSAVVVTAEQSCRGCHAEVAAAFVQPNHHPVPEGRMHCSSCHDVHGTRPRLRDLELTQQKCIECHPRYGGPFVFAHQAGRRDGCVACHLPHGSSNRRLLQQSNSQQNCLQCHGDFPAFHDQTSGAVFTDCLRCHTEVHGSNHSRFLFR